jgi:type III secretion system YscD/HrpQ family protein
MGVMDEKRHDTVFEEEEYSLEGPDEGPAVVDFEFLEAQGRWLVKVVSGPNSGAEFSLLSGSSYLIGTEATSCDIVFNDLSVSRQHARILVDSDDRVFVEDLHSRNGTFVDGEKITERKPISANALITMGTTTFMLIDREGEHKTIVSPLFVPPSAKKEETKPAASEKKEEVEMGAIQEAVMGPLQSEVERIKEEEKKEARHAHAISALIVLACVTGILVVAGIGTTFLFKTEEIKQPKADDEETLVGKALKEFPAIRYSFNPANGRLLLIGHLLTPLDRSRMIDDLQQLKFISSIDYSNVVIDEYVWREANQVLAKNPAWKSITISSPAPGHYVMTGFLKTRKQADELNDYISQYFPYLDLLEKRIIVEEDLKADILQKLTEGGFSNVNVTLDNGELQLKGTIPTGSTAKFTAVVEQLHTMPGVRTIQQLVNEVAAEQNMINISDRYQVTGYSLMGNKLTVVVNGKIVMKGDILDGMKITEITSNTIFLEKDGFKYRIDFNR